MWGVVGEAFLRKDRPARKEFCPYQAKENAGDGTGRETGTGTGRGVF